MRCEKNNDEIFNVAEVVKRAKLAMGFLRDSELAEFLGVSRSTLSNWVARNSIDFPLLLGRLDGVDYNWLLTGKGSPVLQQGYCDSELASGRVERLHLPKSAEALGNRSVTLYDIEAAANLKTLLDARPQYALGQIVIPNVPACDGAVYVSGDSIHLRRDLPGVLPDGPRRLPGGEIRQPVRPSRMHPPGQLQPPPCADGPGDKENHGDGHREVFRPEKPDDVAGTGNHGQHRTLKNRQR